MKLKLNIDKMGMINTTSYLSAPNDALLYRTIMRTLYIEKESYRSQMSTEELFDSLKQYDEFSVAAYGMGLCFADAGSQESTNH